MGADRQCAIRKEVFCGKLDLTRDLLEKQIRVIVTILVVDALEPVNLDKCDPKGATALNAGLYPLDERLVVGKTGQSVTKLFRSNRVCQRILEQPERLRDVGSRRRSGKISHG